MFLHTSMFLAWCFRQRTCMAQGFVMRYSMRLELTSVCSLNGFQLCFFFMKVPPFFFLECISLHLLYPSLACDIWYILWVCMCMLKWFWISLTIIFFLCVCWSGLGFHLKFFFFSMYVWMDVLRLVCVCVYIYIYIYTHTNIYVCLFPFVCMRLWFICYSTLV